MNNDLEWEERGETITEWSSEVCSSVISILNNEHNTRHFIPRFWSSSIHSYYHWYIYTIIILFGHIGIQQGRNIINQW